MKSTNPEVTAEQPKVVDIIITPTHTELVYESKVVEPTEPAVAVQAEPTGKQLLAAADTVDMRNAMGEPLYINSTSLLLLYRAFRSLTAHPKPAAPATAEEVVSNEAIEAILNKWSSVEYTTERVIKELRLALRSGASAQPVKSFGPLNVRCPACKSEREVACIGTGRNGTHWERRQLADKEASAQPAQAAAVPPIERDEAMDRAYIPMPGGWEVQTQGKGSSFRICDTKTRDRWIITDKMAHKAIEQMARDANAATQPAQAGAVQLLRDVESYMVRQPAVWEVSGLLSRIRAAIDRLAAPAQPAAADPYATYGKRGECDKPAALRELLMEILGFTERPDWQLRASELIAAHDSERIVEGHYKWRAAQMDELLDASKLGLSVSESWINERFKTKGINHILAMKALDPIRVAIAKATGEKS